MAQHIIQTNLNRGEITPRLRRRIDLADYHNGLQTCLNGIPLRHGGVRRRPGTYFVAEVADSTKKVRLVPFVFSRTQSYVLEFGAGYMRVFKEDGQVLDSGTGLPYEKSTTYTEAELPEIRFTQSLDVLYIAHTAHRPAKLTRAAHDNWTLADIAFKTSTGQIDPTTAVGTAWTYPTSALKSDNVRAFYADANHHPLYVSGFGLTVPTDATILGIKVYIEGHGMGAAATERQIDVALTKTGAIAAGDPKVALDLPLDIDEQVELGDNADLWADTWTPAEVNAATFGVFVNKTSLYVDSEKIEIDHVFIEVFIASAGPAKWAAGDYPGAVTFYEQRAIWGGTPSYPVTIWGTRIGDFEDMAAGTISAGLMTGLQDDDPYEFTLCTDQYNPILHLVPGRVLIALTHSGEAIVTGDADNAITPTHVKIQFHTDYGCNLAKPVRVDSDHLFVQRAGRKVRSLAYAWEKDAWIAPDLTVLSEHITAGGVTELSYAQEPEGIVWAVRGDGVLLSCTIDQDQKMVGWARHVTAGLFESVATVPYGDWDRTWVVVKRTIGGATKRFVEYFYPEWDMHDLDDPAGLMVDCAIAGTSVAGATVWGGLDHLVGETVEVIADGVYMGDDFVVSASGEITLPRTAHLVEAGLPYDTEIVTLPPALMTPQGVSAGQQISVPWVAVSLLDSIGGTANGEALPSRAIGVGVLGSAPAPYTGEQAVNKLGWDDGKTGIVFRQDQALPFHVLAVLMKVQVQT